MGGFSRVPRPRQREHPNWSFNSKHGAGHSQHGPRPESQRTRPMQHSHKRPQVAPGRCALRADLVRARGGGGRQFLTGIQPPKPAFGRLRRPEAGLGSERRAETPAAWAQTSSAPSGYRPGVTCPLLVSSKTVLYLKGRINHFPSLLLTLVSTFISPILGVPAAPAGPWDPHHRRNSGRF